MAGPIRTNRNGTKQQKIDSSAGAKHFRDFLLLLRQSFSIFNKIPRRKERFGI
jgi:hypothetical protein